MLQTGKPQKGRLQSTIRKTIRQIIAHDVSKSAAALTYNLLFALFPLLIFVSNLLGLMELNVASITAALLPILPDDVVYLLESYLNHVTHNSSEALFWFSLVFTVWFPMRAVKGLMDDVRLAYGLGKPEKPVFYMIRQLLFTIVFLVIIILLFFLAVLGRRFVTTVTAWLGIHQMLTIPPILLNLWQYLRFALVAAIMFAVLGMLYAVAQDRKNRIKTILPGVALAMVAWLVVSIGFSAYVENFADYSVIYGTLGAVIVLLVWLYLTSFILILGAEFNAALACSEAKQSDADKRSLH